MNATRPRGFSLIELMVTLAVAAILFAIAIPAFDSFVRDNRSAGAVNEFMAAANLARAEAIRRSTRVTLCWTSETDQAKPTCNDGAGDGWEDGWMIFNDVNNDNVFDPDGEDDDIDTLEDNETLIKVSQAIADNFRLRATGNLGSRLIFTPSGETAGVTNGTLTFCDIGDGGEKARRLIVAKIGRLRVEKATNVTCPS